MKSDTLLLGTDKGDFFEVCISSDKIVSVANLEHTVTSVDLPDDCGLAAAGSSAGKLLVKTSKNNWGKKIIAPTKFDDGPIIKVRFVGSKEVIALGGGHLYKFKFIKVGPVLEV